MKSFIVLILLLFSMEGYCQNFDEKPFTFLEKQLISNLKISDVKKNIPSGYSLSLEESDKVVLEKTLNGKIYDITYYYDNGSLTGMMFTQHSSRIFKEFDEMRELNFKEDNNLVFNGIETTMYSKVSPKFGVILTLNEDEKILTGTISKMK
jgi:hypothetical protein